VIMGLRPSAEGEFTSSTEYHRILQKKKAPRGAPGIPCSQRQLSSTATPCRPSSAQTLRTSRQANANAADRSGLARAVPKSAVSYSSAVENMQPKPPRAAVAAASSEIKAAWVLGLRVKSMTVIISPGW
jgi:hypothetical protein